MTAPTVDPLARQDVAPADGYKPGDPIWVHRHGEWRPGEVKASGLYGVQVRYEIGQGTRIDTVRPEFVMPRKHR